MLTAFYSQLVDEIMANVLLHFFLKWRRRAPVRGPSAEECPELFSGNLQQFYSPVPTQLAPWTNRYISFQNDDETVWEFRLTSEIVTRWPENNCLWGRHFEPRRRQQRRAVVCVNGIVQIGGRWFRDLADRVGPHGVDVVMMDTPFNFRRTPAGYRPGQLILNGDLAHQLAVSRQAVLDLWRIVRILQQQGYRVGLLGISYGGWLSLLTALLCADLDFVISVAPPVNMIKMFREGGTLMRAVRYGIGPVTLDHAELRRLAAPVVPACWSPRLPGNRITLHAARYDRFVPPQRIVELAELWGTNLVMHDEAHYRMAISPQMMPLVGREILDYWDPPR